MTNTKENRHLASDSPCSFRVPHQSQGNYNGCCTRLPGAIESRARIYNHWWEVMPLFHLSRSTKYALRAMYSHVLSHNNPNHCRNSGNRIKFPIGMLDPIRAETEREKASKTKIGAKSIFLLTFFSLHALLLLSSIFHQELHKTKRGSVVSSSPSLIYAAFFLSFVLNSPSSANCPVISI